MAEDDFDVAPVVAPVVEKKVKVEVPKVVEVVERVETPPIVVTLDMTFAEVVKHDSSGRLVRFSCEPKEFLRLSDEQVDKLSALTRGAYLDAARTVKRALEEAAEPNFLKGTVYQGASATARLEVRNKEPGMHYAWLRPDSHRQAVVYDGYQVVADDAVDTFARGPSTVRTVGDKGEPEYILYKIPDAEAQKRIKESEGRSRQQLYGAQDEGLARLGNAAYDAEHDPADTKRSWRDRTPGD